MSDGNMPCEQAVAEKIKTAMAYRKANKYESALRTLDDAIAIQPDSAVAWLTKGVVLAELGKGNESQACYDKLIQFDAASAVAYRLKGATYEMQGAYPKAAECFLKAVEMEPSNMELRVNLANSYKKQKKFDEALKTYQQILDCEPLNPKIHYFIGVTLGDMGNYEASIGFFNEALRLKPDYSDATLAKGFVLTKLGRKEEAKQCTDKLVETKKEASATGSKEASYAALNDSCRKDYEASQRKFKDAFAPPS